ncbi:unnamed protein product, partial [Prorocentrum cordatum]
EFYSAIDLFACILELHLGLRVGMRLGALRSWAGHLLKHCARGKEVASLEMGFTSE